MKDLLEFGGGAKKNIKILVAEAMAEAEADSDEESGYRKNNRALVPAKSKLDMSSVV